MNVPFKKPFNRKLNHMVIYGMLGIGALAVIALSLNNPNDKIAEQAEAKEQQELARAPVGDEAVARHQLESEVERLKRELALNERKTQERDGFDQFMENQKTPGFDPDMLRLLDEAQKEVSQSPEIARKVDQSAGRPLGIGHGGNDGANGNGLVYDNYPKRPLLRNDDGGDLFADDDDTSRGDAGVYETLRPRSPPAERIISQGSSVHAVLMSRIDTRNSGQIIAMVTRNVYDSKTMRLPLVPQGSRLVGEYSTSVIPGADRLEVNFNRLIFPDGRAFDLPAFQAAGGDGTIGVKGKYRSNLLQAIGPSFLVAILGQAIDRQSRKHIKVNDGSVTPGLGGAYQSQSILEQITPEINREIMQRYQGAKPYFIIEPGQQFRLLLSEDVEVPVPNSTGGVH